jgi:D-alanyl-D-alanine carboxypeptidase
MKKYLLIFFFILVAVITSYSLILLGDKLGLDFVSSVKDTVSDLITTDSKEDKNENNVDTRSLEVSYRVEHREIYESQHAVTLKSNKEIELRENNRVTLYYIEDREGSKWYVAEVNNIAVGDSTIKFIVFDKSGNEQEIGIPVTRVGFSLPLGATKIEDWEGSQYVVNGDNLLTIIDKQHKMVDDYEVTDLVDIKNDLQLYANVADLKIKREAGLALKQMVLDLQRETGKTLTILSGYRSHNNQVRTYSSNVRSYGQEEADTFSARPGFSEHHLGTVVDFYSPDTGDVIFSEEFDNTVAGQWLLSHAVNYGFVQTYPRGVEHLTGYQFEPWQYRFIGVENAKEVKESGKFFVEWVKER